METKTHNLTPAPRKRALPRVWKRFYQLKRGETFFHSGSSLYARAFLPVKRVHGLSGSKWLFPWTRVRTTTLVRDVLPGGKSGPDKPIHSETLAVLGSIGKPFPSNMGRTVEPGITSDDTRTGPSA